MKKELLSCAMIIGGAICFAETPKNEWLPVISEEEHKNNLEEYTKSQKEKDSLQAQIDAVKAKQDDIKSKLHNHDQRNKYERNLVSGLTNNTEALKLYKKEIDDKTNKARDDQKEADNGIKSTAWIGGGVTKPKEGSRAGKEYASIDALVDKLLKNNEQLYDEHSVYENKMLTIILPKLAKDLNTRNNSIESLYLPGFKECGLTNFDCLSSYSITREQMRPEFIENFITAPRLAAYKEILEHKIPVKPEELIALVAGNNVTKESVEKSNKNKEAFKAAINPQSKKENPIDLTKNQDKQETSQ